MGSGVCNEHRHTMVRDDLFDKASFSHVGKGVPSKGAGDQHDGSFFPDPGGEVAGSPEMELGKAHTAEMQAGELLEIFQIGYILRRLILDKDDLSGKVGVLREKITKLPDGIEAVLAAIIGDDQVLDGFIFFRDDDDRAFRCMEGFLEEHIGLARSAVLAKELATEYNQVREPAFFGKEGLIPALVIFVRMLFDVERLTFAGKQRFIPADDVSFMFPDLQVGVGNGDVACAGYEFIIQGTEEQPCETGRLFLHQLTEEVKGAVGIFFTRAYK